MKNKILLVGLFCCSLVSTEAQVLLDKNAGKNSFPIVSPAAHVVVLMARMKLSFVKV